MEDKKTIKHVLGDFKANKWWEKTEQYIKITTQVSTHHWEWILEDVNAYGKITFVDDEDVPVNPLLEEVLELLDGVEEPVVPDEGVVGTVPGLRLLLQGGVAVCSKKDTIYIPGHKQ